MLNTPLFFAHLLVRDVQKPFSGRQLTDIQIEKEQNGLTFAQQMLSKTDFVKHADKIVDDFFAHYERFIQNLFITLRPRTSLTKRRISSLNNCSCKDAGKSFEIILLFREN